MIILLPYYWALYFSKMESYISLGKLAGGGRKLLKVIKRCTWEMEKKWLRGKKLESMFFLKWFLWLELTWFVKWAEYLWSFLLWIKCFFFSLKYINSFQWRMASSYNKILSEKWLTWSNSCPSKTKTIFPKCLEVFF